MNETITSDSTSGPAADFSYWICVICGNCSTNIRDSSHHFEQHKSVELVE